MRGVARVAKPESLRKSATKWTRELLAAIKREELGGPIVRKALKRRYAKDDVRASLRRMYSELCCYCESRISDVAYDHIEHRNPQNLAPELSFEWTNLHLACPRCNGAKLDKWNATAEILDAAVDEIADHLTYKESDAGVRRWPLSHQGGTTVDHADLNRPGLLEKRARIYLAVVKAIREIIRFDSESVEFVAVVGELKSKRLGEHGSLIAFALSEFLDVN